MKLTGDHLVEAIHKSWESLPKAAGMDPDFGIYKVGFYDGVKWLDKWKATDMDARDHMIHELTKRNAELEAKIRKLEGKP